MRDRLSRVRSNGSDDGRTILEAVVALSILATTAAAWAQLTTAASRAEIAGNHRATAGEVASSEIEVLRSTPDIELGTDGDGGTSQLDGFVVLTDGSGPDHSEAVEINDTTFTVNRFVLDPGSTTWRRIVVIVSWDDDGAEGEIRLDTAIPVIPDPAVAEGPNLLLNGGFEFASGGPSPGNYMYVAVPDWSGNGGTFNEVWGTGHNGIPTSEGNTMVELNGLGAGNIAQTVSVTVGTEYRWSIDHRGRIDDDTLSVQINGVTVDRVTTAAGAWVTHSGTYTATSTRLELKFQAVDSGSIGNLVDNAKLVEVG